MDIVLASQSPRRRALLQQLGVSFTVAVSNIEEHISNKKDIKLQIKELALRKAWDVSKDFTEGIIVGADTLVVKDGKPLGKPRNYSEAKSMLTMLSGTTHQVITGVALVMLPKRNTLVDSMVTSVTFRGLTEEEIEGYLSTGEYVDKAGAYGIQGRGAALVKGIEGCYFNVVGLPLGKLTEMLGCMGVKVLGRGTNGKGNSD